MMARSRWSRSYPFISLLFILKSVRKQFIMTTWVKIPPPWLNKVWSSVWLISLKHRRDKTVFCSQVTITKLNACELRSLSFCVVSLGFAIKCQVCTSTTSMEDCKKNEKEKECGRGFDRCFKSSFVYKVMAVETKSFAKGCAYATNATLACDGADQKFTMCSEAKESQRCEWNCCNSDGCNSSAMPVTSASNNSAMPVISAFLLVICTLVSKMCY